MLNPVRRNGLEAIRITESTALGVAQWIAKEGGSAPDFKYGDWIVLEGGVFRSYTDHEFQIKEACHDQTND